MKERKPTSEGRKAEKVLQKAVAKFMEENRKLGLPVAVMREGKAVLIPAEQALLAVKESRGDYSARRRKA